MRVLVTGASSMLGRGVAMALAQRGDDVTVLQRRPADTGLREVLADVADAGAVRHAAAGQEAVIHLAAKVGVTGRWAEFVHANIVGTRSVVSACRAAGVGRLVHVSSPSVAHAGQPLVGVPAEQADPVGARGHYSRSKAVAESVALAAAADRGVVAIRPHLVWGPGDTQLIGRLVERARTGRLPIVGSGAALIDTTYVSNAVDALVAALDRCEQVSGRALVVSNGEPRTISELLAGICTAAGATPPHRHVPGAVVAVAGALAEAAWGTRLLRSRAGDLDGDPPITRFVAEQMTTAHWFDQRETREALDWRPQVSLDEGLAALARSYAR